MSIRLRLTLLYTGILALTLAGLGGVLYGTQWRSLRVAEARVLSMIANRLLERLESGEPLPAEFRPQPPPGPNREVPARRFGLPEAYWQVFSVDGRPLIRSPGLEEVALPLSQRALASARRGDTWSGSARVGADRFHVVAAPVVADGAVQAVLAVAHSVTDQYEYLATLRRNILFGSGGVVILAFGCGWVLSGVVLRPVEQITRTAGAIGNDRDFGRRVDYRGPNDEIGELATTFNAMLGELETAYNQQQQFVADVSHELRTPLTTLRGNLELLRRDPPVTDQDRAEVLDDMTAESERLIRLVGDLLALARADARRSFRADVVLVKPLVEDVCRQARLLDPQRPIRCDVLPDAAALADPDALKQVLLVLLDNALKHTDGSVSVEVAMEDGAVCVDVQDEGPGIPPEELKVVFDRFYQGPAVAASEGPGLGLGLSIARALIEAQGGSISVHSELAQGSRFSVRVPLADANQTD